VSGRGGDEAELVRLADLLYRELHAGIGHGVVTPSTLRRLGEALDGVPLVGAAAVLDRVRREVEGGGRVSDETRAAVIDLWRRSQP